MHSLLPRFGAAIALSIALLGLAGCGVQSRDVLAQAYVAPESLNLRRELAQKNNSVAVLKHGERVYIVDVRRRFVKIRTDAGAEGWVDATELLSPEEMAQIRRERDQALALLPEGAATVYETLNVHLEPDRRSPAFAQIPEGGSVTVLGYRLAPKITGAPHMPSFAVEKPQPTVRKPRHEKRESSRLPPKPLPPGPPANWEELSSERVETGAAYNVQQKPVAQKPAAPSKPVVVENWTLVRTKDHQCGWVLSRNLMMAIPDEVAQYAEGKRITSYFDLGAVTDEEKGEKHNWLWTTSSEPESYDFDAWRVFLWNRRHHRYETSYRQRDLEGYFPVHVEAPDANAFGRMFEIVTKDDDGRFRRRTYLFDGVRVHLTATEEYRRNTAPDEAKAAGVDTSKLRDKNKGPGWLSREWLQLKRRLAGGG